MVIEYDNEEVRLLVETGKSTDKQYRKLKSNVSFAKNLCKTMLILRSAPCTDFLDNVKSLNYERLKHGLSGYSSVRIGYNSKYRLLFTEFDGGIRIKLIEINEHYGDK